MPKTCLDEWGLIELTIFRNELSKSEFSKIKHFRIVRKPHVPKISQNLQNEALAASMHAMQVWEQPTPMINGTIEFHHHATGTIEFKTFN